MKGTTRDELRELLTLYDALSEFERGVLENDLMAFIRERYVPRFRTAHRWVPLAESLWTGPHNTEWQCEVCGLRALAARSRRTPGNDPSVRVRTDDGRWVRERPPKCREVKS